MNQDLLNDNSKEEENEEDEEEIDDDEQLEAIKKLIQENITLKKKLESNSTMV